ncbi:hypothetical protein [Kutzneria sp. NPDC052558]
MLALAADVMAAIGVLHVVPSTLVLHRFLDPANPAALAGSLLAIAA